MTLNDPGVGGDKLPLADLKGSLLLFTVHEVVTGITTSFGITDAVRCDVAVLDGPQKAATYADTLVFPKWLQGQLRGSVGEMVIGRLGQGDAKAGQSPPWTLAAVTDDEKATGERYLQHVATLQPAAAAPTNDPF